MWLLHLIWISLGIGLLYWGGEFLVHGAIQLAGRLGLSPLLIGMTVVAFATSCPELAASLTAVFQDAPFIAVGNVIGSNIANVGLILGVVALLGPLSISRHLRIRSIPFMVVGSALLWPLFRDERLSRIEGLFLFTLLLAYLIYLFTHQDPEMKASAEGITEEIALQWALKKSLAAVALGVLLLVVGAKFLVVGAVDLARLLGISERVIGLSVVAFGTSLPELASSLVAARRGEGDLILGNIVGSNIFNALCILGVTAMVQPIAVGPSAAGFDFWVMMGFSLLLIPILDMRSTLGRMQGVLFLGAYLSYLVVLFWH